MNQLLVPNWAESADNMLIREVADPNSTKLFGLAELLDGLIKDRNALNQISIDSFVKMAQEMQIPISKASVPDLLSKPPFNDIMEPIEPGSNVIRFKRDNMDTDVNMPVNRAQDVVASAAKRAAAKRT